MGKLRVTKTCQIRVSDLEHKMLKKLSVIQKSVQTNKQTKNNKGRDNSRVDKLLLAVNLLAI